MRHFQVSTVLVTLALLISTIPYPFAKNDAFAQSVASAFPGAGRKYAVVFPKFRAELDFHSATSLTFTLIQPDGGRGRTETVNFRAQPIATNIFLITWQEANKTTVVQVEDFASGVIFTNITRADGTFIQDKGTFSEIK